MKISPATLMAVGIDKFTAQYLANAVDATQSSVTLSANEVEALIFQLDNRTDVIEKLRLRCDALELRLMAQPDYSQRLTKLENKIKALEELTWL